MKYLVTEYKDKKEKEQLLKKGLYCYDLRDSDFGNGIASIEPNVLVNRVGSIITDKSIYFAPGPDDFVDYDTFVLENKQVESIKELLVSKMALTKIKLDTEDNIIQEFDFMFSACENYDEIDKLTSKEKKDFIIDHYQDVNDYDLMSIDDMVYQLYSIDYSKVLENDNKKERGNTMNYEEISKGIDNTKVTDVDSAIKRDLLVRLKDMLDNSNGKDSEIHFNSKVLDINNIDDLVDEFKNKYMEFVQEFEEECIDIVKSDKTPKNKSSKNRDMER
ncbi:MAG: hypothetical protein Q4F97_10315 [Bacteroidales bacterium]|nr:hypothetical protein [Bacteroidales bacterium]